MPVLVVVFFLNSISNSSFKAAVPSALKPFLDAKLSTISVTSSHSASKVSLILAGRPGKSLLCLPSKIPSIKSSTSSSIEPV